MPSVDALLGAMTLEEKVAQLGSVLSVALVGPTGLDQDRLAEELAHGLGHVSMAGMLADPDPLPMVDLLNGIQRYLVEETRLGIPVICHNEALCGPMIPGTANFPTGIALAATFEPSLVERMADVTRQQLRALGIHHALSPVLDVARDARWGRVHETYGEDPYLCSAMGVAFVRGLQGDDLTRGVVATAKHFVGHALSDAGRNQAGALIGERELADVFIRPFEAAIRLAGLASVMNSYAELDGIAPAGSRRILTDLLRGELGFDGVVVSDYNAIEHLATRHHVAADLTEAGIQAVEAGLDVELPTTLCYGARLVDAVKNGQVSEDTIDISAGRVLAHKIQLGLFENPYVSPDAWRAVADRPEHAQLARNIATRSIVLLKNDGILPLRKDLARLAVIGPNAHSIRNLFSSYTPASAIELRHNIVARAVDDEAETIGEINARIAELPNPTLLAEVEGLYRDTPTILAAIRASVDERCEVVFAPGCVAINSRDTSGIADAVALARSADVAVLVLGDKTGWQGDATSGEGRDRASLELPGAQAELLRAVCNTATPVVVVLVNGRVAPAGSDVPAVSAVLEAWQPGAIGGAPVADVLFGDANPGGRLPVSVPRTAGQCPIFHYHKAGSGYRSATGDALPEYTDIPAAPAWPFGHGLSYTTFEYRGIQVTPTTVDARGRFEVAVDVANVGGRAGDEVVQLYARDVYAGVTRPVQELIGFARVPLDAGAVRSVRFTIDVSQLAFINGDGRRVIEPGTTELMAGGSSADLPLRASLEITGDVVAVGSDRSFLSTVVAR